MDGNNFLIFSSVTLLVALEYSTTPAPAAHRRVTRCLTLAVMRSMWIRANNDLVGKGIRLSGGDRGNVVLVRVYKGDNPRNVAGERLLGRTSEFEPVCF